MYAQFFPGGNPEEFCRHVFRSFDKDGSGSIEFKEFLLAINITSNKGNPKDKLNWAFDMYDIDGNGTIDKSEMESIIKVRSVGVVSVVGIGVEEGGVCVCVCCLLYTSPSPRDWSASRMPSSA